MNRTSAFTAALFSLTAACGSSGPADVNQLLLPGSTYYPESMNIAADGTIFVGSLATGEVVKFAPGSTAAQAFVPAGAVTGVTGVLVDDAEGALYLCTNDLSANNPGVPVVRSYRLSDGAALAMYPFPKGGLCNDMAFDGARNLFVTDSSGNLYELAAGAAALKLWSSDPFLAPVSMGGFGADGIAYDGHGGLYVNNNNTGGLARLPINADGSAGAAAAIAVTPALTTPDGMRILSDGTLLLVENSGSLTRVTVSGAAGTATTVRSGLLGPTAVVRYGQYDWVSEGQLGHFLGLQSGPPVTPFDVRRIAD